HAYESTYRSIVMVYLDLAVFESNPEQAEALRWEAWQWLQKSKARTLQENLAASQDIPLADDPAMVSELDSLLAEISKNGQPHPPDEPESGSGIREAASPQSGLLERLDSLLKHHLPAGAISLPRANVHSREALAGALGQLTADKHPAVVVEFFRGSYSSKQY